MRFRHFYREAAPSSKISFGSTALCWSSETLPCFSSRRFDPPLPPPNSTIYHANVERSSPSSNSSIYHRASSVDFIRSASIAFSWHTVMKIYRELTERREMEGGWRIIEMAYCRSPKVSEVLSTVSPLHRLSRRPMGKRGPRWGTRPQDSTGYIKLFIERSKRIVSY